MPAGPRSAADQVPGNYLSMARGLRAGVEEFFAQHRPEESVLVIDSTGPMVTRQYLALHAVGLERLSRMAQIHSFSGGTFALFVFMGLGLGFGNIAGRDLGSQIGERTFRRLHHSKSLPVLRALCNFALRRPIFDSASPVLDSLSYILSGVYTGLPFAQMSPNLHLHLADRRTRCSVDLCRESLAGGGLEVLRELPMREIIAMSVAAPLLYGVSGTSGEFYDAVYAEDHRQHIKRVCGSGRPTLVSTPWRVSGTKDSIRFLQCLPYRHRKWVMVRDLAMLLLNLKNSDWEHDVAVAFGD